MLFASTHTSLMVHRLFAQSYAHEPATEQNYLK